MSTDQIVGIALIFSGLVDLVLGFVVIGPRAPDDRRRRILQTAFTLGAALLVAFGAAFLTGALGFGGAQQPGD